MTEPVKRMITLEVAVSDATRDDDCYFALFAIIELLNRLELHVDDRIRILKTLATFISE